MNERELIKRYPLPPHVPPVKRPVSEVAKLRYGLVNGHLPKGQHYIARRVCKLRKQVEQAVLDAKGSISLTDAAAINTLCKWEQHGQLVQHWLRHDDDKLHPMTRLKFSREIANASTQRDNALASLDLDRDRNRDVLDALYRHLPTNDAAGGIRDK